MQRDQFLFLFCCVALQCSCFLTLRTPKSQQGKWDRCNVNYIPSNFENGKDSYFGGLTVGDGIFNVLYYVKGKEVK